MGTEVESPNSNLHVSQIINDSFLFLDEGEEDGHGGGGGKGASNGNGSVRGARQLERAVSVEEELKETTSVTNGNDPMNNSDKCNDVADDNGRNSENHVEVEPVVESPHREHMTENEPRPEDVPADNEDVCQSVKVCDPPRFTSDSGLGGGESPLGTTRTASEVRDGTSEVAVSSDSIESNTNCDTLTGHVNFECDKAAGSQCSSISNNLKKDSGSFSNVQNQISISQSNSTPHQNEAASESGSIAPEYAYEARLKKQAQAIVGKVLNCNSLREALKKRQAWRKDRRLLEVDSNCSLNSEMINRTVLANRVSDSEIHRAANRDCTDDLTSNTKRRYSDVTQGTESTVLNDEQSLSVSADTDTTESPVESETRNTDLPQSGPPRLNLLEDVTENTCTKDLSQTTSSEGYPLDMFTDCPAETTCTVAASAAVKLRRKKSEVGSRPEQGRDRGSCDSASSSPGQSPGPTKRHILRSPVLRIKHEWNSVEIASDSDSSPRQSEDSDDDDDDGGIYAESYRQSQWLYIGGTPGTSTDTLDSSAIFDTSLGDISTEDNDITLTSQKETTSVDSGLGQSESSPRLYKQKVCDEDPRTLPRRARHHRTESISTTASEIEFRKRYQAKTKRIVQRKSSTHTYQRMSERFYEDERSLVVEKGPDNTFGFHIKGHHPVMVTTVETDSPAEIAGIKVGDAVIAVNDVNIMEVSHQEAIRLIGQDSNHVKLTLATDQRILTDVPLCSGFLIKQGGSGILKNWRRRWFVLKQDHCLYYYKTEEDKDPLGAIMLTNYTVTKAPEANRKHTFKAHKYGQRTYYFQAESEEEMNHWASALSNAAKATTKTDTWLDVSSHNVGLPALSIKSPDCHGHLTKMGNRRKNWKRRYCVLKDACLYYYIDLTSSTAQGVAHLHGYSVEENLPFNKKFGFTLVPPDVTMRTFYFCADNETDMKRWKKALRKSISRWVREEDE